MKRNKTVLLFFFLLIASLGFWSWKKSEKPEIVVPSAGIVAYDDVRIVFCPLERYD